MAATNAKLKNFETNYATLENLVKNLESPDLTLAQSLELFEKAIKVVRSFGAFAGHVLVGPSPAKVRWNMPGSGLRSWQTCRKGRIQIR